MLRVTKERRIFSRRNDLGTIRDNPKLMQIENRDLLAQEVELDQLQALAREQKLFAVLDSCDEPAVLLKIRDLQDDKVACLYTINEEDPVRRIAPYLVSLDLALLKWVENTLWDRPWGIFLVTNLSIRELRNHLRKLLEVKEPGGEVVVFRFYDPRVMKPLLLTSNTTELDYIFGRVGLIGIPSDQIFKVTLYSRK